MIPAKLLPCPFCGSSDSVSIEHDSATTQGPVTTYGAYYVVCDASTHGPGGCGASGTFSLTKAEAIAAWNRRAAPEAPTSASPAGEATGVELPEPEKMGYVPLHELYERLTPEQCRAYGDARAAEARQQSEQHRQQLADTIVALRTEIAAMKRQQEAARRVPMSDEEIWRFWWARPEVADGEDDSMEAEFVAAALRLLAAHGITAHGGAKEQGNG